MNIYVGLCKLRELDQINGDRINEIALYKAMSKFANVYYNKQLFIPEEEKNNFNIDPLIPVTVPKNRYDFYYIRNNPRLFSKLPGPKAYQGYPYNKQCFKIADVIITQTDSWANQLKNIKSNYVPGMYSKDIVEPKNIVTFHQPIPLYFEPKHNHNRTKMFRKKFGGDFILVHVGRLWDATYPHSLLHILPELRKKYPNKKIQFVYVGGNRQKKINIKNSYIKEMPFVDHQDIPYVLSACDVAVISNRKQLANWGGCRDVIEAMACGTPVLCGDYNVQKEQLGNDYELFWPQKFPNNGRISIKAERAMFKHLSMLIEYPDYGKKIGEKLAKRARFYSEDKCARRMERDIKSIIANS